METGELIEIIKKTAPNEVNSIIIDNAAAIKRFDYCYIQARVQRVEFTTLSRTAAVDDTLAQRLVDISHQNSDSPFARLDNKDIVDEMEKAPKYSAESVFSSAKKRMEEMMNGGRKVDHRHVVLDMDGEHLSKQQPLFAVKEECRVGDCPNCKGTGTVEHTDKQGISETETCNACKGLRHIGTLSYIVPSVKEKEVTLIRCLDGDIANIKDSTIEAHKGNDTKPARMLTRVNGVDNKSYPDELVPYLEMIHDKTGEDNAIEDIYYHIVPCFTFRYRNVITGKVNTGVVVDPYRNAELLLTLDSSSHKMASGVKDSIKNISRFFGNISKSSSFKDKEDLKRSVRLLIAIAVADGTVSEEEKQSLTLAIRDIDQLTSSEQEALLALLGSSDASFLTDDDFKFHSRENHEETLLRMQQISEADGLVHETERDIIEQLRFKY